MARSEPRTLEIRAKLVDLLTKPLGGMEGALLRWGKRAAGSIQNVIGSVFNLKTGIVGLAASLVSLSTIKSFGEQADTLLKLSAATGDTVENLSELQAAFDLAGVKSEDFGGVLKALLVQSRKAQTDGTDKLAQSFADLGISLRDLQSLGPAQLFEKIAAGLDAFGTAQEKAVALGKVLPKQFLDLLPLLGKGLKEFQGAIVEARQAGATVTEQQAKVSERLNDSLSKVHIAIGGVSRALIEQFGPDAIALFERLAKEITTNRDGIVSVAQAVGTGLVTAFGLAADAVIGLIRAIEKIPGVNLIDKQEVDRVRQLVDLIDEVKSAKFTQLSAGEDSIFNTLAVGFGLSSPGTSGGRSFAAIKEAAEKNRQQILEELLPKEAELRAELADLEKNLGTGLAGALQRTREKLAAELAQTAHSVVASQQMQWSPEDIAKLQQGMAGAFGSVFQAPKGSALPDADAMADAVERAADASERLANNFDKTAKTIRVAFKGDFFAGFNEGAKTAIASWTDYEKAGEDAAESLITGGLDGITNAITQTALATDGASQAWKRLGMIALAELTQIITKLLIVRSLQAAFGFSGGVTLEKGGVMQGDMGTPKKFAMGGIATGPTLALFGEGSNREAFVPLPDNRRIPVHLMGGAAAAETHVHLHLGMVDTKGAQDWLMSNGKLIASVVKQQIETSVGMRQTLQKAVH